jgi:HAD superfamily hydrolase (TIGR01509 family)
MSLYAVLFDLDGTLVDTNQAHIDAWRQAFSNRGYDLSDECIRPEIGKGGDQLVPALLGPEGDRRDGAALRKGHDIEFARRAARQRFRLFDGALNLLDVLRRQWLQTVLVTSSSKPMLQRTLRSSDPSLLDRFDLIVTADDAERSKPAPDLVLAALWKLALPPERCLLIGDTTHDAEAAAQAGVPFVGVACGGCATEWELTLAGAISVWSDPADLLMNWESVASLNMAFAT